MVPVGCKKIFKEGGKFLEGQKSFLGGKWSKNRSLSKKKVIKKFSGNGVKKLESMTKSIK